MTPHQDCAQRLAIETQTVGSAVDGQAVADDQANGGPVDGGFHVNVGLELHGLGTCDPAP